MRLPWRADVRRELQVLVPARDRGDVLLEHQRQADLRSLQQERPAGIRRMGLGHGLGSWAWVMGLGHGLGHGLGSWVRVMGLAQCCDYLCDWLPKAVLERA